MGESVPKAKVNTESWWVRRLTMRLYNKWQVLQVGNNLTGKITNSLYIRYKLGLWTHFTYCEHLKKKLVNSLYTPYL